MHKLILSTLLLAACSSVRQREVNTSSLVRVAIVKLVNASGKPMYDYLSESLTDATASSMDKKFVYSRVPSEQTSRTLEDLTEAGGIVEASRMRSQALEMDADLVICGNFRTTPGKRGDTAEIAVTVFRADTAVVVAQISRSAIISGEMFKEIDAIAAEIVSQMVEYHTSQKIATVTDDHIESSGAKIHLTRKSLNIAPFIPPIF